MDESVALEPGSEHLERLDGRFRSQRLSQALLVDKCDRRKIWRKRWLPTVGLGRCGRGKPSIHVFSSDTDGRSLPLPRKRLLGLAGSGYIGQLSCTGRSLSRCGSRQRDERGREGDVLLELGELHARGCGKTGVYRAGKSSSRISVESATLSVLAPQRQQQCTPIVMLSREDL